MGSRRSFAAVFVAATLASTSAAATTIPSSSGPGTAKPFLGHARPAHPVSFGPRAPRHPYMAANGRSSIHDDAYQSDAYVGRGPLGYAPTVSSTFLVHECASLTFDRRGRIVTVCVGLERPVLQLLDPHTLATLASYPLPPRQPSSATTVFSSFGGGGYFYLDNHDRAVVPTTDGHIDVIAHNASAFRLVRSYDLSAVVGSDAIESALPDWHGRIWFVSTSGIVGFVRPTTGAVKFVQLHQAIGNSFAVDETGAVWIVTDHALYRFVVRRERPAITWRAAYDAGTRTKPGQTEFGSGTTPTIIRRHGRHYIAITDNAERRMHVLVFRAGHDRPICSVPVFARHQGDTDNSLIAIGNAIVVENNYGYTGPSQRPPRDPYRPTPTTSSGVTRINVDYRHGRCHVVWRNRAVRVPSSVSKASAATGLVYVYEHPSVDQVRYTGARPPDTVAADPWYLTALDLRTGRRVWSVLTGYGLGYNNNYAPITLGPDGTAYVGVRSGGLVQHRRRPTMRDAIDTASDADMTDGRRPAGAGRRPWTESEGAGTRGGSSGPCP